MSPRNKYLLVQLATIPIGLIIGWIIASLAR